MGAVLRGHDPGLRREVALKVLLERHSSEPGVAGRFVEEAQIAGQLQHPSVVPVYELGSFEDGRPYFAMKLVKGRTLAALLKERSSPADERPHFLKVFEQVCQAVAYAHSKGVIHRDLKPANVMVGAFGEVQVMDWGLAKVLGGPVESQPEEGPGGTVVRTVRSGSSAGESRPGSVMGTPAYMPPEQALGETDRLDRRCDVFGLGAVLCEILTGRPPYDAPEGHSALRQAMRADLADAFARLAACGADGELVALAKRCLAAEPADRPADAGEVAAATSAYLASVEERLRQAERERTAAEVKAREERKRRKLVAGLAAALLLLLAGAGSAAWWFQQRQQTADAATNQGIAEARLLFEQARAAPLTEYAKFAQALAAARKAEQMANTGSASRGVRDRAAELVAEFTAEKEAADRDRNLLTHLLDVRGPHEGPKFQTDDKGLMVQLAEPSADEQFAAAFKEWGLDVDATPVQEAAARLQGRPQAVVIEVVAALDEWASERRRARKPKESWERLADLATKLDDAPDPRRRELRVILSRGNLPTERALGGLSRAFLPFAALGDLVPGQDRNRLRQLARETDVASEPILALLTMVRGLRVAGDDALAEHLLRKAVQARPTEVVLHDALGKLLEDHRPPRWREAVECYVAVRTIRPELGVSLANALVRSGRIDEGHALFEQLAKKKANPWVYFEWGYALAEQKHNREAEAAYREAIRLKPDYARAHSNLGYVLSDQGRFKEAEAACREAIRLQPDDPAAHSDLGAVLNKQGRPKEAEAACREAIRLKPDYALAHHNLGATLSDQGRPKEAEAACHEAIRLQPDYASAHYNLGYALRDQGRPKEAEAAYREAIRLKPDYALAHSNLGNALHAQGRFREAATAFQKVLQMAAPGSAMEKAARRQATSCERLIELESKLPAILRGEAEPANAVEGLTLADLCRQPYKRLHAAAFRFAADAFATDPKLAADLQRQHRYNAACSAALAAAGQGEDARLLPDKVAFRLRRQALDWLKDDLAAYAKVAEPDQPAVKQAVHQRLQHWQQDPDFASIRDPEALARLPEAERQAWQQLWTDVATTKAATTKDTKNAKEEKK
jgi:serine/threonine-protein kinase